MIAMSAAPYGYTLTLWTSGATATHAQGTLPSSVDALLLLVGAVAGFGAVAVAGFGGLNGVLAAETGGAVRVWGGLHLPSVGMSILLVTGLTSLVRGWFLWPAVGFTATATYLLVLTAQFWLATKHEPADDRRERIAS